MSTIADTAEKYEKPHQKKTPSESWPKLLKSFTESTTLHGLRYVALETKFIFRRLLWTTLVACCVGLFIFYVYDRVTEYRKFKTNVSVVENYIDRMMFPAITICNQNSFRLSDAAAGGWYPVAKALSSKKKATVTSNRKCDETEFACQMGSCIPRERQCDSFPDCVDNSDELNCKPCPRVSVAFITGTRSDLTEAMTASSYGIQYKTFQSSRTAYINSKSVVLSYDDVFKVWQFSLHQMDSSGSIVQIATAGQNSSQMQFVQDISGPWTMSDGSELILEISCSGAKIDPTLESPAPDQSLSLEYLHKTGSQPMEDFILKCDWKGAPCKPNGFKQVMTDMGVCYTFDAEDDIYVESSGPGYALRVTLNIEQYEYTMDASAGAGVQMLMHERYDIPLMQGQSLAISPGLFSMVALERTEVGNLEPQWGNCSQKDLKYYDDYTVSTCLMDCYGHLVREKCKCRDVDMPSSGKGDVPICNVKQYEDCLNPILTEAKKSSDACVCGTPCTNIVYVPSLSFATIATESSEGSQDSATANMQSRLSAAREVSYRVENNKWRETIRVLNELDSAFTSALVFVQAMGKQQEQQTEIVNRALISVAEDCYFFTKYQYHVVELLEHKSLPEVNSYVDFFKTTLFGSLLEFQGVLKSLTEPFTGTESDFMKMHDTTIFFYGDKAKLQANKVSLNLKDINVTFSMTGIDDFGANITNITVPSWIQGDVSLTSNQIHDIKTAYTYIWMPTNRFWNHTGKIWMQLSTMRTTLHASLSSIDAARGILYEDLFSHLTATEEEHYRLDGNLLDELLNTLLVNCTWCLSTSNNGLVTSAIDRIVNYMDGYLQPELLEIRTSLLGIYDSYFKALTNENQTEVNIVMDHTSNLIERVNDLLFDMTSTMIDTLTQSSAMVNEMWRLYRPICETSLKAAQVQIRDNDLNNEVLLHELAFYLKTEYEAFLNSSRSYLSQEQTLASVASSSRLSQLMSYIQPRITSINSLLRSRQVELSGAKGQVGSLFYWILSQIEINFLSSNSRYWALFDMTTVETEGPEKPPTPGDRMALEEYRIILNEKGESFWRNISSRIDEMSENTEFHFTKLANAASQADLYFKTFLEGNQLSESFYKKNFLQMDVYYKALTDKKVIQQKAYEYPALLSELGGLMGLLLGASAITIIEFLDLILYNACVKFAEWYEKRYKSDTPDIHPEEVANPNAPSSVSWPTKEALDHKNGGLQPSR